ncbi:MAG TPA: beta-ketoacyl synthase N-terminal-like domain-containing protein, partial [Pseudonocardiaceae bacterium]
MAEQIAVVGLACRIPGADTIDEFWDLLVDGRDLIEPIPAERIALADAGGWGGFVTGLDTFDPGFFGLAEAEAAEIDPQQRLLLEVAWTALEHAGYSERTLAGSNTGVYIGQTAQDVAMLGERPGPWRNPGLCHAIGANRLSYRWDLHGPSMSIDTACSASLVAVHLAARGLLGGECDLAIAGGVNVLLARGPQVGAEQMAALAPDGRCRPFDAAAAGYVRAEGAGAVVLKRLADAVADGNPIHAVIAGSAVGQDGRTNGLTAPSGAAQQRVIRAALSVAGLTGADVDYVEAHGTGTPLGDPIETAGLAAALETNTRQHPLPIGSVKANIGHLEAAAGIVGLLKAILLIDRRQLVPTPHFATANPRCRLTERNLTVPTTGQLPERPVVGVSSFGFGGTNAHVVLTAPPARSIAAPPWSGPVLAPISAHHPAGVAPAAAALADTIAEEDWPRVAAIARSMGALRDHHVYRCAVVADTADELVAGLRAVTSGRYAPRVRRVAFVYSGQGTRVVRPPLATPCPDQAQSRIVYGQLALTAALREAGIRPDVVVGHSLGELSAAIVAGKLAQSVGLRVLRHRTKVTGDAEGSGAMIAVAASRAE